MSSSNANELSTGVWGILNLTPDSFSDGGRFVVGEGVRIADALTAADRMVAAGATVLDVGGESTRPGSMAVSVAEEAERVLPFLQAISERGDFPIPISIDTRRATIAARAAELGVKIVNDTSALQDDPELAAVVAEHQLQVVLMHRQGTPRDMQVAPRYEDVVCEVRDYFQQRVEHAVNAGIDRSCIILDPGLGFGKRPHDNDQLVRELPRLRVDGLPFLVGASRKSFLGRFDDRPHAERLGGSLAFVQGAVAGGAEYVRVHDVADTVAFLRTLAAIGGGAFPRGRTASAECGGGA